MNEINLTNAYVQRVKDFKKSKLKIPILDIKDLDQFPFILVIQAVIENNIKLSIYPLKEGKITKVSLSGFNLSDENFQELTRILRERKVIHTSGVILIHQRLFYECYLIVSETEEKSKDLKTSFNKIKNIEEIKIEEIVLQKHKK